MESVNYLINNNKSYHPENYNKVDTTLDKAWFSFAFEIESLLEFSDITNNWLSFYIPIPFEEIKEGDFILFIKGHLELSFAQAGKVYKKGKTIDDTIVRTNFGNNGIYEYRLENHPISYGRYCSFWRKIKDDSVLG